MRKNRTAAGMKAGATLLGCFAVALVVGIVLSALIRVGSGQ